MHDRAFSGLCIGGPLDGQQLTSRSEWHRELIQRPAQILPPPYPPTNAQFDSVEYHHVCAPWREPSGRYRYFYFWLVSGICEAEMYKTLQQRLPDGPPR